MSKLNLNRRMVLQSPQTTPDGAGGRREAWVDLGTLWGAVQSRTGREAQGEAGSVALIAHRVIVRAAPVGASNRPVPGQRFRMEGRFFRVLSVTEREPGGMYLQCETREEVAS